MTWVIIDLFGEEQTEKTEPDKEEVKLEPVEDERDRQLHKQVINIHGEIVTI